MANDNGRKDLMDDALTVDRTGDQPPSARRHALALGDQSAGPDGNHKPSSSSEFEDAQVIDKKGLSGFWSPSRAIPLLLVGTLSFGAGNFAAVAQDIGTSANTPNIIWIMADDLGYGDLGSYGQRLIRTPRLDQMASEGTRFTNAYAGASYCTPSRAVLMTGLHQGHVRPNSNPTGSRPDTPLDDSVITVAEILRESGYSTALIGKWGLGGDGTSGAPWNQGFGHFFGYLSQRRAHNYYPAYLVGNEGVRIPLNNEVVFRDVGRGQEIGLTRNDYSHDLFVDDALEWIEGNRDGPFFLYLSLTIPHANNYAHELIDQLPDEMAEHRQRLGMEVPDFGPYADEDWAAPLKGTAAMVTRMDAGVGKILDRLEELGIDRHTIVFFTSDNGPANAGGNRPAFFDSNGPFRGLKGSLREGALRVPMIVRWPTRVPAGSVSDLVWHFADFLPTAAEFAGAELAHPIDGESIVPDLLGQSSERSDRFLYWRQSSAEQAAVRWGKWKAVRSSAERPVQLYNLEEDPGEGSDVACWHQGVVTNMRDFMDTLDEHANLAPVFTSSNRFDITGSPSVVGTVVAEDHDDAVSGYWVAGGPHQDRFQISDSGVLTFAPGVSLGPSADEADTGCVAFHTLGPNQYGVLVGAAGGTGTRRRTSLQRIVASVADGSERPLIAAVLGPNPLRHAGQGVFSLRIGFSEAIGTGYVTMRDESLVVTNGTVRDARRVDRRNDLWEIDIAPSSEADIRVVLPATTDCAAAGAVCTRGGKRLQTRLDVLIPGPSTPEISIAALASPVTEGTAAAFELTLDRAAPATLTVAVNVTESGSVLSGPPPVSVLIPQGRMSATFEVPTAGDTVVDADSTVTAAVTAGAGYVAGTASRASVTVQDDDAATFTVTAEPATIREGESATLTVAIANGVTFGEEQTIFLAPSGTVSVSDYSGVPPTLTLPVGASAATARLVAEADEEEEEAETITVTASHSGSEIGSASVTIRSVSRDATLASLSLSGIDIGTFSGAVTSYEASVAHSVTATTVTATASHSGATVTVEPGAEVTLAEGSNEVAITVTAEDGTTTRTYTVTVTRLALPVATIAAGTTPVTEGATATFTVRLDQAAPEALTVAVEVAGSGAVVSGTPPASVSIAGGATSATLIVPTDNDRVVEADSTVTAAVAAGTGYTVGTEASASVAVEDDDAATFSVSVDSGAINEGESTTLTVSISNGVTFAEAQTISLATSGTAAASDYTGVPLELTLAAGESSVTVTLVAATDEEEEDAETITVTASHGGSEIGSASVTIHSVSRDATLASLSLSGVDIGTFSGAVTSYEASVAHSVTATTVTATASHSAATVTVEPGAEVTLAEGANEIAITVTAEDGTTTRTYTVTVTRLALPVVSIEAFAERVAEGDQARFRVRRAGSMIEPLDVGVSVISSIDSRVRTETLRLEAGSSVSETGYSAAQEDAVIWDEFTITWTIEEGEGYVIAEGGGSATVVVEENDVAEFALRADPESVGEGSTATLTLEITNGLRFAEHQTISLSATGGTASAGTDFTLSGRSLTLRGSSASVTARLEALEDEEAEDDETVTLTARLGDETIATVEVTIRDLATGPLTAEFAGMPAEHDGQGAFWFELRFSAEVRVSYRTLRDAAFEVTGGTVTEARRREPPSNRRWQIAVEPDSDADVVLTLPATLDCGAEGAICTAGGKALSGQLTATVEGPGSTAAEFALRADPESVAEGSTATLTLEITNGVRFAEQQTISLAATGGTASAGTDFTLSGGSLTLPGNSASVTARLEAVEDGEAEEDETVTLTARLGDETIATLEVTIRDSAAPLTAEFAGMPAKHDGQGAFGFELRFSEEVRVSYRTLRDTAFEVTGGTVTEARRREPPSNRRWQIAVEPDSDADVVLTLPATLDCGAEGAICTAGGKALSGQLTATVKGPASTAAGFGLAPENSSPSGIWSDGETAWVADLDDARLYAYRRSDGQRQPARDIATDPGPMGLWSDRETLWVAGLEGGVRAHRLADGARLPARDLAVEANKAPAGVWSDGETVWVSGWLGDTVHAYRLAGGKRVAGRDIKLAGQNLMPTGVWSDGETLWVADWQERLYAYRLADGQREPRRDIRAGGTDTDPTGLWSGGGTLLSTTWEGGEVRAYRVPVAEDSPAADRSLRHGGSDGDLPMIGDASLKAAIRTALDKAPGETISARELAGLESLSARNSGVRELAGLEFATGLKELDLGFNPLADLGPLAALPALESLNLDGATLDLGRLMALQGLRRLSVRHSLLDDLQPLVLLGGLTELDIGDNRIEDLGPLQVLTGLEVLRADRNRIEDLWPLAGLTGLKVLDLGANGVRDLQPLDGLERLVTLRLGGNRLSDLHPLSRLQGLEDLSLAGNAIEVLEAIAGLDGLQRLDLRGNAVRDLRPVRGLSSLVWVHVGGSRIEDLAPLDGLDGLEVAGRDDLESPGAGKRR